MLVILNFEKYDRIYQAACVQYVRLLQRRIKIVDHETVSCCGLFLGFR